LDAIQVAIGVALLNRPERGGNPANAAGMFERGLVATVVLPKSHFRRTRDKMPLLDRL
jgi:hypothetical protein